MILVSPSAVVIIVTNLSMSSSVAAFVPYIVPPFPELSPEALERFCQTCESCEHLQYESAIVNAIDTQLDLYGTVQPFRTHICIATDRMDWVHSIEEVPGVAQLLATTLDKRRQALEEQAVAERIVLTNSSMANTTFSDEKHAAPSSTSLLVLGPELTLVSNFDHTESSATELIDNIVNDVESPSQQSSNYLRRDLELDAVVLICSHSRRDKRCGKTAPILIEAFEILLREV